MKLRDSVGKFTTKNKVALKIVFWIWVLALLAYVLASGTKAVTNWYSANDLIFPQVLAVHTDWPVRVIKRQPITVVSPIEAMLDEKVSFSDLTPNEKIVMDTFGIENFRVMRAISKCESGLREDAYHINTNGTLDVGLMQINYETWKKTMKDQFGYTLVDLFDAKKNAQVAKYIYDRDGVGMWTVSSTGCFTENL
jgi:hypothetical protein